jgi:hypothetical protein
MFVLHRSHHCRVESDLEKRICLGSETYFSSESTDTVLPLLVDEDFCNSNTSSFGISSSDSQPPPAWPGTCAERVTSDVFVSNVFIY